MENHISAQLVLLGQSVLLGAGLAVVYDLFRPLRLRRPRLTWMWDGLYCLTALLCVFLFLLRCAAGTLRLYILLGLGGGAVFYFCLLCALVRPIWDFWADTADWIAQLLALPLRGAVRM